MSDTIDFEAPHDAAGFTIFPNAVLMDESLTMPARMTYALLVHYARQDGSCFPGQATLARNLGVTARSVHTYLTELREAMLVAVERRGRMKSNRYVLLALGLRAKRLRDRKEASGQGDRKQASGVIGSRLPTDVDAPTDTQTGERERASAIKFSGKPVNAERWALTTRILDEFNSQTGRDLRLLTSAGQPSEAASLIYGRVTKYPDLPFEQHQEIIRNTLASKWWDRHDTGERESVNVIYGKNVFEQNISRKPLPANVHRFPRGGGRSSNNPDHAAALRAMRLARAEEAGP